MLLDCFAIPCVLVLSKFALGAQFTRLHLVGAAACVVGAALTVFSDVLPPPWGAGGGAIDLTPAPHPLVGAKYYYPYQLRSVWPARIFMRRRG